MIQRESHADDIRKVVENFENTVDLPYYRAAVIGEILPSFLLSSLFVCSSSLVQRFLLLLLLLLLFHLAPRLSLCSPLDQLSKTRRSEEFEELIPSS